MHLRRQRVTIIFIEGDKARYEHTSASCW